MFSMVEDNNDNWCQYFQTRDTKILGEFSWFQDFSHILPNNIGNYWLKIPKSQYFKLNVKNAWTTERCMRLFRHVHWERFVQTFGVLSCSFVTTGMKFLHSNSREHTSFIQITFSVWIWYTHAWSACRMFPMSVTKYSVHGFWLWQCCLLSLVLCTIIFVGEKVVSSHWVVTWQVHNPACPYARRLWRTLDAKFPSV